MLFFLQVAALLIYSGCLLIASFLLLCLLLLVFTKPYPKFKFHPNERFFKDYRTDKKILFPSLRDAPTVHLSVIIPAYDEEKRLPPMLDECLDFLETRQRINNFLYEVIIVSDGSRDKTVSVASRYSERYGCDKVRILELIENRGKGGAVRLGMLCARGALVLFADADGATKFSDLTKLENMLEKMSGKNYLVEKNAASEQFAIAIGSRAHMQDDAIATRSIFRTILMYGFHFLVWFFTVRNIQDTQCGFKLLTRSSARICFYNIHVEKWAFDVELLYIAQRLHLNVAEVAVNWTEIDGSKVTPVWSWLQMGIDLFLIWLRYRIGAWRLRKAD